MDLGNMKLHSVPQMLSYICTQSPYRLFPLHFCLSNISMYTFIISVTYCMERMY